MKRIEQHQIDELQRRVDTGMTTSSDVALLQQVIDQIKGEHERRATMRRIMLNAGRAKCLGCTPDPGVHMTDDGRVVCTLCGSEDLVDAFTGARFVPIFKTDARCPDRVWPVYVERRHALP